MTDDLDRGIKWLMDELTEKKPVKSMNSKYFWSTVRLALGALAGYTFAMYVDVEYGAPVMLIIAAVVVYMVNVRITWAIERIAELERKCSTLI